MKRKIRYIHVLDRDALKAISEERGHKTWSCLFRAYVSAGGEVSAVTFERRTKSDNPDLRWLSEMSTVLGCSFERFLKLEKP